MHFDRVYQEHVLSRNFEDFKQLFFAFLLDIHRAHLLMLVRTGILAEDRAGALKAALQVIEDEGIETVRFDGTFEDAFFLVEKKLEELCGPDLAGRLHIARSRNDIDVTLYRLRWRGETVGIQAATHRLRTVLLGICHREVETVFPMYTHTQAAQPSTIAHYFHGVVEHLERDHTRLSSALLTMNRCPMGACAITGTSFPIDRHLTARLLAFEGPTGNTAASIGATDYLFEPLSAIMILLSMLGRVLQDLLLWSTTCFRFLRLADGWVQSSSIMPQKRNPVSLEHSRAIASRASGQARAAFQMLQNTPFGDIVDAEDDLQPLVGRVFDDARGAIELTAAALEGAVFDRQRLLSCARDGWITASDLADALVARLGLPFRSAHRITAVTLKLLNEKGLPPEDALAEAGHQVAGMPIRWTRDALDDLLCPSRFVARRDTPGGPKPAVVLEALKRSEAKAEEDRITIAANRQRFTAYRQELRDMDLLSFGEV